MENETIVIRAGTFSAKITMTGFANLTLKNFRKLAELLAKHRRENEYDIPRILRFFSVAIAAENCARKREKLMKRFEIIKKELN